MGREGPSELLRGDVEPARPMHGPPLAEVDAVPTRLEPSRSGSHMAFRTGERRDDGGVPRLKLVVSDLHMGTGHRRGEHNPWESFAHDEQFCEFLEYHSTGDFALVEVELIINGDFFDLLQVPVDNAFPLQITEAVAVAKVRACMDGHDAVMAALARFLEMPKKRVTVLPGNHDPEWVFPAVQRAFTARLTGLPDDPRVHYVTDRPTYEFDGVQIQHGQQLEFAHFHNYAEPFLRGRGGEPILHLPWGSQFLLSVMMRLKEARPYIDRVRPFKLYLIRAILFDPLFFARTVWLSVVHFLRTRVFNWRHFGARMRQNWKLLTESEVYPDLFVKVRHTLEHRPDLDAVILGHTHIPLVRRLKDGRQYINGGCWTDTVSLDLGSFGQRSQPTYVLIEYSHAGARPVLRLRQWNGRRRLYIELVY